MPTTYTDQFFNIDPSAPPPPGTFMTFSVYSFVDNNNDGDVDAYNNDSVNGRDVTASYPGDTVTINVPGTGIVTYTGITFYLSNGTQVFTPTDGQILQNGTLVSTTWVSATGPLDVDDLGPPCFAPGTLIACPGGERPVETLVPGDLVLTRDRGARPLRWVGQRSVAGQGALAPVRICAGALGNARDLVVSPQHRVLICGWQAELLFGEAEVLVAAKALLGHDRIFAEPCREATYHHLMFDGHEIILSEGIPTESFDPGGRFAQEDAALREELLLLFPELAGSGSQAGDRQGRWRAARPVVRVSEARAICA